MYYERDLHVHCLYKLCEVMFIGHYTRIHRAVGHQTGEPGTVKVINRLADASLPDTENAMHDSGKPTKGCQHTSNDINGVK